MDSDEKEQHAAYRASDRPMADGGDDTRDYVPFYPSRAHVPEYYRPINPISGAALDWLAIAGAFALDPARAMALKYILRAGRKPGESADKALTKAQEMLERAKETK